MIFYRTLVAVNGYKRKVWKEEEEEEEDDDDDEECSILLRGEEAWGLMLFLMRGQSFAAERWA